MTFCIHDVGSGRAEQHSISLSSLSKHKDNGLRGSPMEKRKEKLAFPLFFFQNTYVKTDLTTLFVLFEAEQYVVTLKKHNYPSVGRRCETETASQGGRGFDWVAFFVVDVRNLRCLKLVTVVYCVEKQASQPRRAIDLD